MRPTRLGPLIPNPSSSDQSLRSVPLSSAVLPTMAAAPTVGDNNHPCCVHIDDGAPARRGPDAVVHCSDSSPPPPPAASAVAAPNGGRLHHRTTAGAGLRPDGHRGANATTATDGLSGVKKDGAWGCPPNHKPPCTAQEPPSPKASTTFGRADRPGAALPLAPAAASSGLLEPSEKRSSDVRHPTAPGGHAPGATDAAGPDPRPEPDAFLVKETGGSPQASSSNCLHHSATGSICTEAKDSLFTRTKSSDGAARVDAVSGIFRASIGSDASDESSYDGSVNKPHKANDSRWEAIRLVRCRNGFLGTDHFKILKQLGCGDIGTVYLAELRGTRSYFAVKRMDKETLASRKKLLRAQTEKEILQCLDHPFLPTLYTHFETDKFSYLVMEFCPGGDLHTLRQRQPGKYFSEQAARFYVAEVLLALEYLHMLGIIYRDLKPENVLVRQDGHIMLSDFDLSLRCAVCPTLVKSSSTDTKPSKKSGNHNQPSCVEPSCTIQPSCIQPTCFAPHFLTSRSKKVRKPKRRDDVGNQVTPLPELIAEPTNARSMSFVGTHEYLAPEIVKGEGHGSAVDWWTFGIFLYELLFGRTPFKGSGNRATLFNVVGEPLRFPESPIVSFAARDLIRGLLVKEPQHRLAYRRGATEVKQHPFFHSVNWALIRCGSPPAVPRPFESILDVKSSEKYLDMNFF